MLRVVTPLSCSSRSLGVRPSRSLAQPRSGLDHSDPCAVPLLLSSPAGCCASRFFCRFTSSRSPTPPGHLSSITGNCWRRCGLSPGLSFACARRDPAEPVFRGLVVVMVVVPCAYRERPQPSPAVTVTPGDGSRCSPPAGHVHLGPARGQHIPMRPPLPTVTWEGAELAATAAAAAAYPAPRRPPRRAWPPGLAHDGRPGRCNLGARQSHAGGLELAVEARVAALVRFYAALLVQDSWASLLADELAIGRRMAWLSSSTRIQSMPIADCWRASGSFQLDLNRAPQVFPIRKMA